MIDKKEHKNRRLTPEELERRAEIREAVKREFPPKNAADESSFTPPSGIPSLSHDARKRRGMTRYEIGKRACVPSVVVQAIERGDDVSVSQLTAVAGALGLSIEFVEQL